MEPMELSTDLNIVLCRLYRQELRDVCQYFITELTFTKEEFKQILHRYPQLLKYSLAKFQANVGFFQNDCNLDNTTIRKMIRLQPLLLVHSIHEKVKPVISFLRIDLRMENWKRIISRYPQLLSIPITSLQAKVHFNFFEYANLLIMSLVYVFNRLFFLLLD